MIYRARTGHKNIRIQIRGGSYCKLDSVLNLYKFGFKDNLDVFPIIGPTVLVEWKE